MSCTNKTVIVTGGSSGIGEATAVLFAKEGANVVIVGRNEQNLNKVAEKCASVGKNILVIKADLANEKDAMKILDETISKFGGVDVLVNNAGISKPGSLLEGNILQAYDETMNVNVRAVINLTALAVPYLVKSKGCVVNISSVAALRAPVKPDHLPYHISKAALDHYTRGAAAELASKGIRVNSVNPGPVATNFFGTNDFGFNIDELKEYTSLKRVSTSEEVGDLVFYLASDKAKGITGSVFVVDNGLLLL